MERRLSVALAAVGLLAALALFLLGRKSPDDVRAAAADLDGLIRETTAGVQARADTLAQLPRLGWAVATDEDTMRDLTTEELAFRPHPGEHIEITQMRRGGGEPRRLLRLPVESDLALPVIPGTHLVVQANEIHVVTVVSVEPRQRADELVGILAVAKQMDPSPIAQRLAARGINAELRTIQRFARARRQSAVVGRGEGAADRPRRRGGRAGRRERRTGAVAALAVTDGPGRVAAGGAAALAARRYPAAPARDGVRSLPDGGARSAARRPGSRCRSPPPADLEITAQPVDLEGDQTDPERTGEWVGSAQAATPAIGNPVVPEGAVPEEQIDHARSGRVESRSSARVRCRSPRACRATAAVNRSEGQRPISGQKSGEACSQSS